MLFEVASRAAAMATLFAFARAAGEIGVNSHRPRTRVITTSTIAVSGLGTVQPRFVTLEAIQAGLLARSSRHDWPALATASFAREGGCG